MSVESIAAALSTNVDGLTPTGKLVLIGIANHDGDGGAWPSVATLAKYAGVSVRSVQRHLRNLEELGLVVTHKNKGGNADMPADRRPNRYTLNLRGDTSVTPRGDTTVTTGATPLSPRGVTPASPEPSLEPSNNQLRANGHDPFTASFALMWGLWPNRHNKQGGLRAYRAKVKAGAVTEADALAAARRYAGSPEATKDGGRFSMHMATFFGRDERWREYLGEDAGGTFVDDADRLAAENDWMVSSL
jgi:DNA-binding MarR family transcriptional regulator